MELTHLNEKGRARMVDVSNKGETKREAIAKATIAMKPGTLKLIKEGGVKKGDVLAVAQVAGVQGAKRTPDLIPMCHPLRITGVDIKFSFIGDTSVEIYVTVKAFDKTGVEMEALTAAATAALTIYDMCKAVDKGMEIKEIVLVKKSGGKSGTYVRD
jgi:cyclic pyranopterin phosphate synthase